MTWPTSADYDEAVQNLGRSMSDPELRDGQAARTPLGLPMLWAGGFADVYKIHNARTSKTWALKFFKRQIAGQADRYRHISTHLQRARLPFMVDFQYLDEGVRIRGEWFPVLKMHWVEGGIPLNTFVESHLHRPRLLHDLLGLWVKMARLLRQKQIAHADLQHDNVLLVPRDDGNLALKLIDYDGMHIPALEGAPSGEIGLGAYQHPQRKREGIYSAEVDRFSHLAIYCAIHCLTVEREKLWRRFNNGSNLLFKEQDFNHPTDSEVFQMLWQLPDTACRALVGRLVLACPPSPLHAVPLLDEITTGHVLPLTPAEERAVDAILKGGADGVWSTLVAPEKAAPTAPPVVMTPPVVPPPAASERMAEIDTVPLGTPIVREPPRPSRPWPTPMAIVRRVDQRFGQATGRPQGLAHNVLRVTALAAPLVMLTLLAAGLWRWYQPGDNSGEMTNSLGMVFNLIAAGEFQMGSDWQQHRVRITKSFHLGVHEVTQEQYERVMGVNSSNFKGPRRPVESVSWDDAVSFCDKLSALPKEQAAGRTYRLPTEAEWEYACRAGSTTPYAYGDDESALGDHAWFDANSSSTTHPVGEKQPNAWGLYDMHGNVWEWCADWYDEGYYTNTPLDDPAGPITGSGRVYRGGCWDDPARGCRAAYRLRDQPSNRYGSLGFRVATVRSGSK